MVGGNRLMLFSALLCLLQFTLVCNAATCTEQRITAIWTAGDGGFIPKCDPKGDFEPIQCDAKTSECYCVHTRTGEEIPNTRVLKPSIPNCDYPALGATEVDLVKAIAKHRGKDIVFIAESFEDKPSYEFQSSRTIYTLVTDYFPPSLWSDFSILATVKPMTLEGGFLFAVVDSLETVVQLGLSISSGDNEYTQKINLWYSENLLENGYMKIAEFTVPVMVGRWSKFAIGVNGTNISLHLYCKSYANQEYKRELSNMNFVDGSYLLIGHGGDVFTQPFEGEIQELLLTNNPSDAARQCETRVDDKKEQLPGGEYVVDGQIIDDTEPGEDEVETGSGFLAVGPPREPVDPEALFGDSSTTTPFAWWTPTDLYSTESLNERAPAPAVDGALQTRSPVSVSGPKGEKGAPGEIGPAGIGLKGEKGDAGMAGTPGKHGINGIPGLEGEIGPPGLQGAKGEKGETGVGKPGKPGVPGESVKGDIGEKGIKGAKGEMGDTVVGPQGPPGKSFFMELEEVLAESGSGEEPSADIFSRVPTLELLRGPKGETGNCTAVDGAPGRDGVDGEPGAPGLPGTHGERGETGERGASGTHGSKGDTGSKGEPGIAGLKGEKGELGERGPQGIQGPPGPPAVQSNGVVQEGLPGKEGAPGQPGFQGEKGEKGDVGEPGVSGEKGVPGEDGAEGPQGARGDDGINGQPGLPGVTGKQGVPGVNGTKGEKGDAGIGLPGPVGPPGPPGTAIGRPFLSENVSAGAKGEKGERGAAGAPGALDLGDLADIIPLLKEKGDKGDAGEKGEEGTCLTFKGQRGRRGHRGVKGYPGIAGPKGMIGAPGFPGQNGIPGAPGTPGDSIKGEKGDTGGCSCETGSTKDVAVVEGPPGPQGAPGEAIVGPPGPPGPPGLPGGAIKLNTGNSLGNILMFSDQSMMSSSSLAIPSGTLGFVADEQRLYIRVNLGWQAIMTGPTIPMRETNSLPFLQDFTIRNMKDAAAATGKQQVSGLLRLYALNTPLSGAEIGGVSGADYLCYKQSREAGISGTFRAVLTSRLQSVDSLVFDKDRDLAVANSQGERLLDSWSGVSREKGFWAADVPIYTFNGSNIHTDSRWSKKHFWHGASSTGVADPEAYCQAWTSNESSEVGAASSYLTGQVLDKSLYRCDTRLAVLCIETTLANTHTQR